ncbi:MAG: potassium/proton antiporter [Oscillospiraceae bacterium]|nr:potassium/proton antiporter [Oscillospiraceae bacterium]
MFSTTLLIAAAIIMICVAGNKIFNKIGIPVLLVFIGLGMLFGSDGIMKIPFEDYGFAEKICNVALIFIMFYGGFGTNMKEARPVAAKAILLSSAGVILTAALTTVFCFFVLRMNLMESMLIGSVLSSTDAASVFSVLRSKNLNLKYNTASMLEMESGSNDPFSYMLTIIVLSMMHGEMGAGRIIYTVVTELSFALIFGALVAYGALWIMRRFHFHYTGHDTVFVLGVAIAAYALPAAVGGNGYLGVYIVGLILGNSDIGNKKMLVHFFDGVTSFMEMLIFFLLGLLSFPTKIWQVALPSMLIALFLTFIARPVAVGAVLAPFKTKLSQYAVVSWAGLRGAASIVFTIEVVLSGNLLENDIFHIAFCVVLFSIMIQGTLLPFVARKTNMIDKTGNVLKTFNDYSDETEINFIRLNIKSGNAWIDMAIKDIHLPPQMLFAVVMRRNETIIPNGETVINEGDTVILGAPSQGGCDEVHFREVSADDRKHWCGKTMAEINFPSGYLVIMIKRGDDVVIPVGSTVIEKEDKLVMIAKNKR